MRARACVRACGAGCVCQRRVGALWVRQCAAPGHRGRRAAPPAERSGAAGARPPCPGLRVRGLEMRKGNSRLADVAGLYHLLLIGVNSLNFTEILLILSAILKPKGNGN